MHITIIHLFTLLAFMSCGQKYSVLTPSETHLQPPRCEKVPHVHKKHKDTRSDDYFWLNQRENPKTVEYLLAENRYAHAMLAPKSQLQSEILKELEERVDPTESSAPVRNRGYFTYKRYQKGQEYPYLCRKTEDIGGALGVNEEIILNVNELAQGVAYYHLGKWEISPDHKTLAYAVDTVGRRLYTIHFKDIKTGKILPNQISNTTGNFVWANDSETVFYVKQNQQTLRWDELFRYQLKSNKSELLYFEKDETFHLALHKSNTQAYIILTTANTVTTEQWLLSADKPKGKFEVFLKRKRDHEYYIADGEDRFFIHTNLGAKNFRVVEVPKSTKHHYDKKYWTEVIAPSETDYIAKVQSFKNHLAIEVRRNGLIEIDVVDRRNLLKRTLPFKEVDYVAGLGENLDYDSEWLRFHYESLATPEEFIDYNWSTRKNLTVHQTKVLGQFQSSDYQTERRWAKASDGAMIPISLVYKKGIKKDGSNPMLLIGYGSYGLSLEPRFDPNVLSLLKRGMVYALAHIRGGQEMGRAWYENGKVLNKKNTFTDYIAVAETLIAEKYTSAKHLYAQGGSAGGLLMGAVLNMRPDLFNGMIATVPFVDVLTTMLDASIPLTTLEYDQWGNPEKKEFYDYIKSYSPYDNVAAKNYPHLLVMTGFHDSQVQYWEPAKWVARLRELKTDQNQLLFLTDMESGHSGKTGRFDRLKLIALRYTFILSLEGK